MLLKYDTINDITTFESIAPFRIGKLYYNNADNTIELTVEFEHYQLLTSAVITEPSIVFFANSNYVTIILPVTTMFYDVENIYQQGETAFATVSILFNLPDNMKKHYMNTNLYKLINNTMKEFDKLLYKQLAVAPQVKLLGKYKYKLAIQNIEDIDNLSAIFNIQSFNTYVSVPIGQKLYILTDVITAPDIRLLCPIKRLNNTYGFAHFKEPIYYLPVLIDNNTFAVNFYGLYTGYLYKTYIIAEPIEKYYGMQLFGDKMFILAERYGSTVLIEHVLDTAGYNYYPVYYTPQNALGIGILQNFLLVYEHDRTVILEYVDTTYTIEVDTTQHEHSTDNIYYVFNNPIAGFTTAEPSPYTIFETIDILSHNHTNIADVEITYTDYAPEPNVYLSMSYLEGIDVDEQQLLSLLLKRINDLHYLSTELVLEYVVRSEFKFNDVVYQLLDKYLTVYKIDDITLLDALDEEDVIEIIHAVSGLDTSQLLSTEVPHRNMYYANRQIVDNNIIRGLNIFVPALVITVDTIQDYENIPSVVGLYNVYKLSAYQLSVEYALRTFNQKLSVNSYQIKHLALPSIKLGGLFGILRPMNNKPILILKDMNSNALICVSNTDWILEVYI